MSTDTVSNNDVAGIFTEAAKTDNKKKLQSVISWNGEADEFTGWKAQFEANLMLEDEDLFEVLEKHSDETYEADAKSSRRIMALLLQSIPKKSPLMNGLIVLKNDGMKAYREWHLKFAGATAMRVMNLSTKITSIERGHGETIANYIMEMVRMELLDLKEPVSEMMMVGLAMRLGDRRVSDLMSATLHDVTSFEEVKKKLLIYETRDQHAGVKSEPPVRRNPGEVACGAKYLKGKRCGYCNKKGHSENDCMTKQRDEDKSDGVVRCYYCQKRGHVRRECPRKARHDEAGLNSESGSSSESDDADSDSQKKTKKGKKGKKQHIVNGCRIEEFKG